MWSWICFNVKLDLFQCEIGFLPKPHSNVHGFMVLTLTHSIDFNSLYKHRLNALAEGQTRICRSPKRPWRRGLYFLVSSYLINLWMIKYFVLQNLSPCFLNIANKCQKEKNMYKKNYIVFIGKFSFVETYGFFVWVSYRNTSEEADGYKSSDCGGNKGPDGSLAENSRFFTKTLGDLKLQNAINSFALEIE